MSKSLGIKIDVDFSAAMQELDAFKKKWDSLETRKIKLDVDVDQSDINKIDKKLKSIIEKSDDIKLKVNENEAVSSLNNFKTKFKAIRDEVEKGLDLKLKTDFDSGKFKGLESLEQTGKTVASNINLASKATENLAQSYQSMDGYGAKFQRTVTETASGLQKTKDVVTDTTSKYEKMTTTFENGSKKSVKYAMDEVSALKDIANITKEIGQLEVKSVGKDGGELEAMTKRIGFLKTALNEAKADYQEVFGKSANSSWLLKETESAAQYNLELRKAAQAKAEQAQADKESQAIYKDLVKLENERFSLIEKASNASGKEADALLKQADGVNAKLMNMRQYKDLSKVSSDQLQDLSKMNEYNLKNLEITSRLKNETKSARNADKQSMSELKASYKEIMAIQKEMNNLQAQDKEGILDSNGQSKLAQLEKELKVREEIYAAQKKEASDSGTLTGHYKEQLEAMERTGRAQVESAERTAQANAKVKAQTEAYKQLEDSVRRVVALERQKENAGNHEAAEINKIISSEEQKQAQIRESIQLRDQYNSKLEESVSAAKQAARAEEAESEALNRARDRDNREYSGVFAQALDPQRLYQEGKQAAMVMYDSVATLDKEFTNIAKVADVPSEVLDQFSKDIFSQASAVGKAADEYATSVERWLVTGKTFQEAQDLSQVSVMGGFVGNIGEEEMVKYMSVPLENFRKDMLSAEDIVNSMNEVSNNNAVEMDDLGKAYSRAANTAANAGTSFAELTGMIAGANTATRAGGEKIGTALKSIDLNFGKIASETTKEDAKRSAFFDGIGVKLKDDNDQLRSTYDIVGDLARVWGDLNGEQKTNATMYAAGKNHAPVLQGMIDQWDTVIKATKEAEGQVGLIDKTSGSAFKEFETQQESVEYKAIALKNTWTELLNTIAGGRDGINGVLDVMTNALEVGVKLANNDGFMKMAGSIAKMVALGSGAVGINKMFKFMKSGIADVGIGFAKMQGSFKMMRNIGNTGKNTTTPFITAMGGAGKSATKINGTFAKTRGIVRGVSGAIGGMIPVIGGVITAMSLLDAAGVPVWETLGKGVKKVGELFETTKDKAEEANKEFVKNQEEVGKNLKENKLFDGTIGKAETMIKSYKDLRAEKEKAFKETGDYSFRGYTSEEFTKLQSDFDAMAESLGLDISLEFNDYDYIHDQFSELIKLKNELTGSEIVKASEDIQDSLKPMNLDKAKESYTNSRQELLNKISGQEETVRDLEGKYNAGETTKQAWQDALDKLQEYRQEEQKTNNFYSSEAALKAKEADRMRNNNLNSYRENVGAQAEKGYLSNGWGSLSDDQKQMNLAALTRQAGLIKENSKAYQEYQKEGQSALNALRNGDQEHAKISKETLAALKEISPEYETLGTNVNAWAQEGIDAEQAFAKLDSAAESAGKKATNMKEKLAELAGQSGGFSPDQIQEMNAAIDAGGAKLVSFLGSLGDYGAAFMNVGTLFRDQFGDQWANQLTQIQSQIDGFNDVEMEKAVKLKLITEDGLVNGETLDSIIQAADVPEIQAKFKIIDDSGNVNIQNTMKMLEELGNTEFSAELKQSLNIDGNGVADIDAFVKALDDLEMREEILTSLGIEVEGEEKVDEVTEKIDEADGKKAKAEVEAKTKGKDEVAEMNTLIADWESKEVIANLIANTEGEDKTQRLYELVNGFNGLSAEARLTAENQETLQSYAEALGLVLDFDGQTGQALFTGDDSDVHNKSISAQKAVSDADGKTSTAHFNGDTSDIQQKSASAVALGAAGNGTSVWKFEARVGASFFAAQSTVNKAKGGGSIVVGVAGGAKSLGINRDLGRSMSASIGNIVGNQQSTNKSQTSTSQSKSSGSRKSSLNDDARVNEDTWRYWAKELFKGLPLDRSMENLENAIKRADDNVAKLIPLYKQQQNLISQQIAYNKDIKKATQTEMNHVLSELRKQGFKTSGNKVTNLGRAKSLKGDKASDAEEMLNRWKSLYEELDKLNGKINSLNLQKWEIGNDIKDANITKESQALEKRLKKTEALLTSIENHVSVMSKKDSFISGADYELKMAISEEGINSSSSNISKLINEFNSLSKTSIKYGENASDVQSQLDSLKSEILNNADAIIDYRNQITEIRLDRMISDYSKFNDVMERNSDLISRNIEALQEGLLSGTSFGDLESSKLGTVDFQRKNALEKQYQDRLKLEMEIDQALEAFGKKNVDRAKKIANAQLTIERNKYNELLKMQKSFTNGKAPSFNAVGNNFDIGSTKSDSSKHSKHNAWLDSMKKLTNQYSSEYSKMTKAYDDAMSKAKTQAERESLTNKMIVDQMALQEKLQKDMINQNNKAIAQAEQELKNTSLTTEQREELLDLINTYRDANIDAQETIKKSIESRFDLEFELQDKAFEKAKKYTEHLEHLLEVSQLVGLDEDNSLPILRSLYDSRSNEYSKARSALMELMEEQKKYTEGSFEWKLVEERIADVRDQVRGLTIDLLNANKDILGNRIDSIEDSFAKGLLDGKTLNDWNDYQERWVSGIEKEIELDRIRQRLVDAESDANKERLEILDRQEEMSRRELDYLDKQTKVLELQGKLNNLEKERSVQTLIMDEKGNWNWGYEADQTEVDKTKDELLDAEKELEKFRQEQRGRYVSDIQSILDRARNGEFKTSDELSKALQDINDVYGQILNDIPDLNMGNFEDILGAYEEYLKDNKKIVDEVLNEGNVEFDSKIAKIGDTFEKSFLNIADKLGKTIGDAVLNALDTANSNKYKTAAASQSYVIERLELDFPNVTDANGLEDVLMDLPNKASQFAYRKK